MKRRYGFSKPDPKARMKVVSKIERIQPTVIGTDERGEFIWEGREMPRWQQEMFRIAVNVFEFITKRTLGSQWYELAKHESKLDEFGQKDSLLAEWIVASKEKLDMLKAQYPRKARRNVSGD